MTLIDVSPAMEAFDADLKQVFSAHRQGLTLEEAMSVLGQFCGVLMVLCPRSAEECINIVNQGAIAGMDAAERLLEEHARAQGLV